MWMKKYHIKNSVNRKAGFTLLEIMVVVMIIGLLAALCIPNFVRARTTAQTDACINNLRQIDAAKQQWALEAHGTSNSKPAASDLQPYLGHGSSGELPTCPADSQKKPTFTASYNIQNVGTKPTCKRVALTHILP